MLDAACMLSERERLRGQCGMFHWQVRATRSGIKSQTSTTESLVFFVNDRPFN